jgi:pilus assembly protein CpaF
MTDIFKFEQTAIDEDGNIIGDLKPTGIRPLFIQKLEQAGFELGPQVFGGASLIMDDRGQDRHRRRRR